MANFMDELAPGSRQTWRDLCDKEKPAVGTDALLTGIWREAIVAAVTVEKAGRAGRYADGPAGQVIDYLMERGFSKFSASAEKTEQAAHEGRIRPGGGGGGGSSGGKPVCPHGSTCYRKNPEHFKEYSHPWGEAKDKDKWACSKCTYLNNLSASQCEMCGAKKPGGPGGGGGDSSSTLQIRCGRCSHVCTVAVPPGTPAGATVQAKCPQCGCTNQAQMPFTSGTDPKPSAAPHMGGSAPRPSGRRKALLIGVNYFGTRAELRGCINDVHNLYRLLTETYGWPSHAIRTLTDDGRGNGGMPTRQNITQHMQWLSDGAQAGDVLFFSFSGHGAQQEDPHGYEEDGMNETILPVDFERAGMMTDDEISDLMVKSLPEGVRLTGIMDCCHSGSGLDLPFTWDPRRGMWREAVNPFHSMGDVLMFSGCEDDDTSSDAASMYSAPGGAMTTAFCDVLRRNPTPIYPQLLQMLHQHLSRGGFSQRPVLSSTQQFSLDRPFSFDDIHPNMNPQLGRIFRQHFPPRPRAMSGPLADMLGPLGMLAGGLVVGALAGEVLEGGFGLLGALF